MTTSVWLTGASGFIGARAIAPLMNAGFDVHAVSRRPPARVAEGVRWHALDLHDSAAVRRALRQARPTHLLHLAWHVPPGEFWQSPENGRWVDTGRKLLELFFDQGGRRAVSAGSCAEYDWAGPGPRTEDVTPLRPSTAYGTAKVELAAIQAELARQAGATSAWGRIFHLYGPGEPRGRLVSGVIEALLANRPAACTAGTQIRDFSFVDDVAAAFVAVLAGAHEGAINIASGRPIRVKELVQEIGIALERPELIRLGEKPMPAGDPAVLTADVRRLHGLGWTNRVDLNAGIRATIAVAKKLKLHIPEK